MGKNPLLTGPPKGFCENLASWWHIFKPSTWLFFSSQRINQSRFYMWYHFLDLVLRWYGMAVAGSVPHKKMKTMHHLTGNFTAVLLGPARIWS